MGVKKAYHRKTIGSKLYNALEQYAKDKYKYLQVKTVDEGHYKEYDQTIAFYKNVGFSKLEVFPSLWDEWNPCLIMIKAI
jgi:ribosomal protein S18 acetylase RimI-like enzyme